MVGNALKMLMTDFCFYVNLMRTIKMVDFFFDSFRNMIMADFFRDNFMSTIIVDFCSNENVMGIKMVDFFSRKYLSVISSVICDC